MLKDFWQFVNDWYLYREDIKLAGTAPRLHGVNLNQWHFLGRTKISFTFKNTNKLDDELNVFLFCHKDDYNKRHYTLVSQSKFQLERFQHHQWITNTAELWKANQKNLYSVVYDEPSSFLCNYMLEKYQAVWDDKKNWWVQNEQSKYESAQKKQNNRKKTARPALEETNIVKINFEKKEKE